MAWLSAACGDDDDSQRTDTAATSAELVPDLKDIGFTVAQSGKAQGSTTGQDAHTAIFAGAGGKVSSVRVDINLHPTSDAATTQFAAISEALKNPPPDLFGPNAKQQDGTPVLQTDQSRSYKTATPDSQGLRVFTDAYRMGRAVVIIYVIGPDGGDTDSVRKQAAERVNKEAPR